MDYFIEIKDTLDRTLIDILLRNNITFYNSYVYGDFLVKHYKVKRKFLIVYYENRPILYWQVILEFLNNKYFIEKKLDFLVDIFINFIKVVTPMSSPLWLEHNISEERKLFILKKVLSVISKKFHPLQIKFKSENKFFTDNVSIYHTLLVNLNRPLDDIKKSFKQSARKNLRKILNNDRVSIRIMKLDEFNLYFNFIEMVSKEQNLFLSPKKYIKMFFDEFYNKYLLTFLALYDDELIGTLSIYFYNKSIVEIISRISYKAKERKLYIGDLLKWEIIKWAYNRGFWYYDLAGVNLSNSASEKEKRIFQFKNKWGGELKKYYINTVNFWEFYK